MSEKRSNSQYTLFMVTQELEYHFGKTAKEINEKIEEKFEDNLDFSYTNVHNDDYNEIWSYSTKSYDKVLKEFHAHSVIKVKRKMTINAVAELLEIEPQYVEKPKSKGKYAKSNMLAYLIHAKDPDKTQYDPEEVVHSKDALPYKEVYAYYKKEWDLGKAKKRTELTEIEVDDLIEKIENEEIIDKNQILLTDSYFRCYSRHSTRIDRALEIAAERRMARGVQSIKEGSLKQVIFITGEPRKGKSYLTDQITSTLAKEKSWLVGEGAVSNCLDDYNGEEIFVLDDARGSSMKAEEWTRLLDPRKANRGAARYHNRLMSPQVIVFNCYKDIDEFFYFTKGIGEADKSEALDQFIGRILIRLVVHAPNDVDISLSHERPYKRELEVTDRYGNVEKKSITTEHSFVTICEHQTTENTVALVAALVCANQHSGKVTEAMMEAVGKLKVPYKNVLEEDETLLLEAQKSEEEREALLQAEKEKELERKKAEEEEAFKNRLSKLSVEDFLKLKEEYNQEFEEMFSIK